MPIYSAFNRFHVFILILNIIYNIYISMRPCPFYARILDSNAQNTPILIPPINIMFELPYLPIAQIKHSELPL